MMEWTLLCQRHCDSFTWFKGSQLSSVIRDGILPDWFNGNISRKSTEELLKSKPPGYFLIRLSQTRIGFTLSYRAEDRCRHFMINAVEDGYVIVGENRCHRRLQDLVDFHRKYPMMLYNEVLTVACGQDKTDYAKLLCPQRCLKPHSLHPSESLPLSEEDVPPALPHRSNHRSESPVPSLHSPSDSRRPSLADEFLHVNFLQASASVPPVPKTRKRYTDNPPPDQPEVSPRSLSPSPKLNQAFTGTVSAPESPSTATEQPHGADILPERKLHLKLSMVANLKNLRKKFQNRRRMQQHMLDEVNVEAVHSMEGADGGANIVDDHREIQDEEIFVISFTKETDEQLPAEYRPPPPFAPGYKEKAHHLFSKHARQ